MAHVVGLGTPVLTPGKNFDKDDAIEYALQPGSKDTKTKDFVAAYGALSDEQVQVSTVLLSTSHTNTHSEIREPRARRSQNLIEQKEVDTYSSPHYPTSLPSSTPVLH